MTLVEAAPPIDMVAAAFDDPNPQSIIVGHGKLAFASNYDSDDDSLISSTYSGRHDKPSADYLTNNPSNGSSNSSTSTRRLKKPRNDARIANNHGSFKAHRPQQTNLSVSGKAESTSPTMPEHNQTNLQHAVPHLTNLAMAHLR